VDVEKLDCPTRPKEQAESLMKGGFQAISRVTEVDDLLNESLGSLVAHILIRASWLFSVSSKFHTGVDPIESVKLPDVISHNLSFVRRSSESPYDG
jgi:hypothetical protein